MQTSLTKNADAKKKLSKYRLIQICYSLEFVHRLDFEWGEEKLWIEKSLTHTLGIVKRVFFLLITKVVNAFLAKAKSLLENVAELHTVIGINLLFVLAEFYDLELENKTLSQFRIHKGNKELHLESSWKKITRKDSAQTNGSTSC